MSVGEEKVVKDVSISPASFHQNDVSIDARNVSQRDVSIAQSARIHN